MNQACVSLEEVFAAAGARAASLVPETSGYLALAVADATSRLPYLHDDRAVLLTIDGTVMVPRKGALTAPPEAARALRETLRRLLAASTGSMPGLVAAARLRTQEEDVDRVVGDVESALIPVNRSAAKRALARLARETLRAKELGKLKKKAAPAAARAVTQATATGSAHAPTTTAHAPTIATGIAHAPPTVATGSAHAPPTIVHAPTIATGIAHAPPTEAAPRLEIPPPAMVALPAREATPLDVDVEPSLAWSDEIGPDDALDPAWHDGEATIADPDAMAVFETAQREAETDAPSRSLVNAAPTPLASSAEPPLAEVAAETPSRADDDSLTRPWQAQVVESPFSEPAATRADRLLDAFHAEDSGDIAVLAAASSLRAFAGIDLATPLPSAARVPMRSAPGFSRRANATLLDLADDEIPLPAPRPRNPPAARWPLGLFALGLLVLAAAWLYRPTLARDFFGLRQLLAPAPATAPADAPVVSAEPAPEAPTEARPPRNRDVRASEATSDGSHRRRD